jgi:hypothetical protein
VTSHPDSRSSDGQHRVEVPSPKLEPNSLWHYGTAPLTSGTVDNPGFEPGTLCLQSSCSTVGASRPGGMRSGYGACRPILPAPSLGANPRLCDIRAARGMSAHAFPPRQVPRVSSRYACGETGETWVGVSSTHHLLDCAVLPSQPASGGDDLGTLRELPPPPKRTRRTPSRN